MQYTTLIDSATLAANLDHPDWVVVDCRFDLANFAAGRKAYAAGHLPGARFADLDADLSSTVTAATGRHPLPDHEVLAAKLGAWGIDRLVQVVVYDADVGAFAARLWWLLRWLGHEHVALLDGGLHAWQGEGLPVTRALPVIHARHFDGQPQAAQVVSTETVAAGTAGLLLDARIGERFRGELEPIDPVAGHIPGSANLPLQKNLGDDGRFLPATELEALYRAQLGDREPATVTHYCGSGVSACHNMLAMEHAGLAGSRLYIGSWSEWIRDPDRPVALGA